MAQSANKTRTLGAFLLLLLLTLATQTHAQQLTLTLVGTGGPELTPSRSGIATAITTDNHTILIDAGRNTLANLYRSRIDPAAVTTIFLTHLHSDHIVGLPDLWLTPWFLLHRTTPLTVYGPPGTQAMIDGMRSMYAHDIAARANPTAPRELLDITIHELHTNETAEPFPNLRVTATTVQHGDGNPAFAYRVANAQHSIFLTGDSTYTPSLAQAAANAEVLIANVVAGTPHEESLPKWKPVFAKLLTPEQAARLFTTAAPRLAIYSHIVTKGNVTDAALTTRTRADGYSGRLLIGHDHTRITLAKTITITSIPAPTQSLDGTN
jgi:ribonuclease Z